MAKNCINRIQHLFLKKELEKYRDILKNEEESYIDNSDLIIKITDWVDLSRIFPTSSKNNKLINKSAVSSTLVATLELVRNGNLEIKQENMFGPIYIKNK